MAYPGWLGQMDNSLFVIQVSTDGDGDKLRRPFYKYLIFIYKNIQRNNLRPLYFLIGNARRLFLVVFVELDFNEKKSDT